MSAKKSTLIEYLTDSLTYDRGWAVYAQKIDGRFSPESPARFGQRIFENGGLLDDCEVFNDNESIVDSRESYTEGDDQFLREWAEDYIEKMNEAED